MVVFQLGGSVPAIATALQLSAFSLMWPLQHRNPPLIGKIRKLQIIKKDLVFVCCRAEQGGKSFTFCPFYLLVMVGGNRKERSDISATLFPPTSATLLFHTFQIQRQRHRKRQIQSAYIFEATLLPPTSAATL